MKIDSSNVNMTNPIEDTKRNDNIAGVVNMVGNTNREVPINQKKEYELTVSEKAIIDTIEKANKKLVGAKKELEFSIHKETKSIMVKVINKDTDEVIKEIPSEKILDMIANFMELSGIFVDEKR